MLYLFLCDFLVVYSVSLEDCWKIRKLTKINWYQIPVEILNKKKISPISRYLLEISKNHRC